jgi:ABC-type dipeptide/oligopeptide/nickel transport system permease subunit
MISGYFGGRVDQLIQRYIEIQMAFPFIVIAIIVMAFIPATPATIMIVFMFTGWIIYGRVIRGVTLAVRESEYVQSALVTGGGPPRIIYRHILPNIVGTAIVLATLELPVLILAEATLSFLGIGIRPPTPSLGSMLSDGRVYLSNAWWLATLPGLMLMFLAMGFNFLGDGLREVLDPTLRGFSEQ